jgi:CoA:oxalate CoA-transferase
VTNAARHGSLVGLRVLALENDIVAPYATMLLADAGADVIKIEDPQFGDRSRNAAPFRTDAKGERRSLSFLECNRNKRSVALELRAAAGKQAFLDLVRTSDVVVENLGPGPMRDLEIDYGALSAVNPALVLASISLRSGADEISGPTSSRSATEVMAQALSGIMLGATGEPLYLGIPAIEILTATFAVIGILEALFEREWRGIGRHVELSLYEAALVFQTNSLVMYGATGQKPEAGANLISAPHGFFDAKDGIVALSVPGERPWSRFCAAIGRPELAESPKFVNAVARRKHDAELREIVQRWFSTKTKREAVEAMMAYEVPAAPLQTVTDLLNCPHLRARDMLLTIDDSGWGEVVVPGNPIKSSAQQAVQPLRPPRLGEHTDEVLREVRHVVRSPRAPATKPSVIVAPAGRVKGPLTGLRVLALEGFIAGPRATTILADAGADVIKIEDPRFGDGARLNPPLKAAASGEQRSLHFASFNRNKRSVAIDLKSPEGREVFLDLVRKADVVVHNLRPGLTKQFGIDYPVLSSANPRLIYASVSFCGDVDFLPGPYSGRSGADPVAQALAGLLLRPAGTHPVYFGIPVTDILASAFLAAGILQALVQRQKTDSGQRVDITLYDAGVVSQMHSIARVSGAREAEPAGSESLVFPSGVFRGQDGFVALDTTWPKLCEVIGRPDLAALPVPGSDAALERTSEATGAVETWFAAKSKQEAANLLNAQGILAAPLQTIPEVFADPHLRAHGMLLTLADPAWNEVVVVGNPITGFPAESPVRQPPSLGAHNAEVLLEVFGPSAPARKLA